MSWRCRCVRPPTARLEVSPETDPELFYATLGGMGLTGVIVQATLRVEPLGSPWVAADLDRTDGLEQTLELLGGQERHRYSVAWLDLLADGPSIGRAVVSRADPLPAPVLHAARTRAARLARRTLRARCRDRRCSMFRRGFPRPCCVRLAFARSTPCAGVARRGASAGGRWRWRPTSSRWTPG